MRARSISLVALTIAGCAVALGQANFVWDYPTTAYPPPTFTANGDTTFMSSAGGSQIYAATVSGVNPNDYEMRTVLSATQSLAGGTYMHFPARNLECGGECGKLRGELHLGRIRAAFRVAERRVGRDYSQPMRERHAYRAGVRLCADS